MSQLGFFWAVSQQTGYTLLSPPTGETDLVLTSTISNYSGGDLTAGILVQDPGLTQYIVWQGTVPNNGTVETPRFVVPPGWSAVTMCPVGVTFDWYGSGLRFAVI